MYLVILTTTPTSDFREALLEYLWWERHFNALKQFKWNNRVKASQYLTC